MKKTDIIFAIVCGLAVAWLGFDFFGKYGWLCLLILPILSVVGLWLVEQIGKKFLFVQQLGKFVLAGAFADVIDIKVFQLLFWLMPVSLLIKAISFLIATIIKYWANKHWAFDPSTHFVRSGQENIHWSKEVVVFFLVTLVGLGINVVSFYYFAKIKTGLEFKTWQELSIIFAALVSAIWNFLGYKFLVFKK